MLIVQAALAVLHVSPKIVCRLRTRRVECSKRGKTQLIQDAGCGTEELPGFCSKEFAAAGCLPEH